MSRAGSQTNVRQVGYFAQMLICQQMMPDAEREALRSWERDNLGRGPVGTSDWPGWEKYLGPYPEEAPRPTFIKQAIPKSLRLAVFERDGHACVECGAIDDLGLDHIIPESKGGPTTPGNLRVLCRRCNSHKGTRVSAS